MGVENERIRLRILDMEITREKTSCFLESKPINERIQSQVATFLVDQLGASEVEVSEELVGMSGLNDGDNNKALAWIAHWEHGNPLSTPPVIMQIIGEMRN